MFISVPSEEKGTNFYSGYRGSNTNAGHVAGHNQRISGEDYFSRNRPFSDDEYRQQMQDSIGQTERHNNDAREAGNANGFSQ